MSVNYPASNALLMLKTRTSISKSSHEFTTVPCVNFKQPNNKTISMLQLHFSTDKNK